MNNIQFVMFHFFKEGVELGTATQLIASAAHSIHLSYPLARIILLSNRSNADTGLAAYVETKLIIADPSSLMFSRTLAYKEFVDSAGSDGYIVFLDTDMLVIRRFDHLFETRFDIALTIRALVKAPIIGSLYIINMASKERITRFFAALIETYKGLPEDQFRWDGDQTSLRNLLNPPAKNIRKTIPAKWDDLDIHYISENIYNNMPRSRYTNMSLFHPAARILHFKGSRKKYMHRYYKRFVNSFFGKLLRQF